MTKDSRFQVSCLILLTAGGIMSLFRRPAAAAFLLAFLLAVAAAFGSALPERRARSLAVSLGYLVFAAVLPAGLPFLPLVLFEPFRRRWYPAAAAAAVAAAVHFPGAEGVLLLLIGCAASLLLAIGTRELADRSRSIHDIRDTAAEHQLELERRNQDLRDRQDSEIYAATLRERNRIAREIHDSVGHILSRCILMTGALSAVSRDPGLREPLQALSEQLDTAMTAIRTSVHDLHDDAVDLDSAARLILRDFTFCPADLDFAMSRTVPRDVKYCFLSVLKEALTNIEKHSNASHVMIRMVEHPSIYQLIIQDNGTDIRGDFADRSRTGGGIGLANMRDRVDTLHGAMSVTAENGFRIFISIPKETAK